MMDVFIFANNSWTVIFWKMITYIFVGFKCYIWLKFDQNHWEIGKIKKKVSNTINNAHKPNLIKIDT